MSIVVVSTMYYVSRRSVDAPACVCGDHWYMRGVTHVVYSLYLYVVCYSLLVCV